MAKKFSTMGSELASSFLDIQGGIDFRPISGFIDSVESKVVSGIASVFRSSVSSVDMLTGFPIVFSHITRYNGLQWAWMASAVVQLGYDKDPNFSDEQYNRLKDNVRKLTETHAESESTEEAEKEVRSLLSGTLNNSDMAAAATALLHGAFALSWTAFECVAKDLWVESLNHRPVPLGQAAFESEPERDAGISGKQITIGQLAKYGFDLRSRLGTVLEAKFDFTSVSGIIKAYEAAFGRACGVSTIMSDPKLATLEVVRNLIVHRAGIVDEKFKGRIQSTQEVGSKLRISRQDIVDSCNAALSAGVGLLKIAGIHLK